MAHAHNSFNFGTDTTTKKNQKKTQEKNKKRSFEDGWLQSPKLAERGEWRPREDPRSALQWMNEFGVWPFFAFCVDRRGNRWKSMEIALGTCQSNRELHIHIYVMSGHYICCACPEGGGAGTTRLGLQALAVLHSLGTRFPSQTSPVPSFPLKWRHLWDRFWLIDRCGRLD